MSESLYDELVRYASDGRTAFHMPGHKRKETFGGLLPYSLDITEIDGFDNLHDRHGILKSLSKRMAKLWGADYAFPLVGGSTCGILSAVHALTSPGDSVLIDRSCHKSVYNAAELCSLSVRYVRGKPDAEFGFSLPPSASEIKKQLEANPGCKAVIITSPTYEGMIADVGAIADVASACGAKLIVDQAHGAHLAFDQDAQASAVGAADATVVSLHKTLPALTQTAALFVSDKVDVGSVESSLSIFETSSPSYPLLASIDRCVSFLEEKGGEAFRYYGKLLDKFYSAMTALENLRVCSGDAHDPGKIVLSCRGCDIGGSELSEILRGNFGIEIEMVASDYVLAMSTVADGADDLEKLADAILTIDKSVRRSDKPESGYETDTEIPRKVFEAYETRGKSGEYVDYHDAVGKVAHEYVYAYPPGAPIIAAGELIDDKFMSKADRLLVSGVNVCSSRGKFPLIFTVKD